jgi:hypothetical protein
MELKKLIQAMRKQLLPYQHESDTKRGGEMWEVGEDEYISAWIAGQLRVCRQKNRCFKRERCVFYEYSDISRKNYEICYELLLELESGNITCSLNEDSEDKAE